jgi:hypothetical protein
LNNVSIDYDTRHARLLLYVGVRVFNYEGVKEGGGLGEEERGQMSMKVLRGYDADWCACEWVGCVCGGGGRGERGERGLLGVGADGQLFLTLY